MSAFDRTFARAMGWSIGMGAVSGAICSVSLMMAGWGDPLTDRIVFAMLTLPHGFALGALSGMVLGMPVVGVSALRRERTRLWRVAGAALASAAAAAVWAVLVFGPPTSPWGFGALFPAGLAFVSAWLALPRVLSAPAAVRN